MFEFVRCRPDDLAGAVVLCATRRLARHLRAEHDAARQAAGLGQWRPLVALSLDAWLGQVTDAALLDGALPAHAAPRLALTPLQEQALWEEAIDSSGEADGLFDREGLAALAVEANSLAETWGIEAGVACSDETRAFLRWRGELRARCAAGRWLEPARLRAWRIERLREGAGRLPSRLVFAGFDRYTPQERELARVLAARGVAVFELEFGAEPAAASAVELPDRAAECLAAAAWAAEQLAARPDAHLAIVVPDLAARRDALAAALDDALHDDALAPAAAEMSRRYNFSLGAPLAGWPVADCALRVLRMAVQPRRIAQEELARMLASPYWSAGGAALDARARLDARLRELLPPTLALADVLRLARRLRSQGAPLEATIGHLEAIRAAAARFGKEKPSAWAGLVAELLENAGWPGGRTLSSHEWQVVAALRETLAGLADMDAVLGRIGFAEAVRQLQRACRQRVFQPQTEGRPAVEVLGPLEAAGARFDALWVLGMSDDAWPPPPRPNPLLPAAAQRRAGSPNAGAEVQLDYAMAIHRRLLASAPVVVFSRAAADGDRPLRPSPLIAGLPSSPMPVPRPAPAEVMAAAARVESLDDHRAPPLADGEEPGGGVGLLKAQAICPAWAFHRYRLGARPLAEPVEGLDAASRGTLLHRAMERFWNGRDSVSLQGMSVEERQLTVATAVAGALSAFDSARELPLSPRFAQLERARLERLLSSWLEVERARPQPFTVLACEQTVGIDLDGLKLDIRVDRIDELAGGRRVILDYKTGRNLRLADWQGERIVEPQLPAYAVTCAEPPAVVAFAKVRDDGCAFVGTGGDAGLLPGVKAADDWPAMLAAWREAIHAVAREIREGEAAVRILDERQLEYCEVLPLLRLPEYRAQKEKA